ncbi:MAG: hypothetical protein KF850_42645 [Labilithrix sp.]|nr:hypothetical protein [Labilithrix sp.]MBX3218782.1 hypothetical protein [Labilithrix sp.]
MSLGRLVVRIAPPFTLVGCALFTSLDGFSGSADVLDDGGTDVAPSDAGDDARPSQTADAAEEASVAFCATQPAASRCTSFDDDELAKPFEIAKSTSATLEYTTTDVVSAPRALVATIPESQSTATELHAGPFTKFTSAVTKASARFAFRLVSAPATSVNALEIESTYFSSGGSEYQVNLSVERDGRLFVDEYSPSPSFFTHTEFGPLSSGWHVIELKVVLEGSGAGTALVDVDGVSKTFPLSPVLDVSTSTSIHAGAPYIRGVHGVWSVAIDDLVASATN